MEESTGKGGLRRICAELMRGCTSATTNFRPAAVGIILGLYRDNGKETGNYYIII